MKLRDFCYIEDNSLSPDICDDVIDFYHSNEQHHEHIDYVDKKPKFTQMNFSKHVGFESNLHKAVMKAGMKAIDNYRSHVKETEYWSKDYGYEYFRIKHYRAGSDDQFTTHIDSNTKDNYMRFLAFFWYLNDVEVGGTTEFTNFDLTIQPKKGRLFIFPPLWLYPHRGNPTVSNDKFLLSSYLHCA